jgi:hypothetical protein
MIRWRPLPSSSGKTKPQTKSIVIFRMSICCHAHTHTHTHTHTFISRPLPHKACLCHTSHVCINIFAHIWTKFVDINLIDMKGTKEIVKIYHKVHEEGKYFVSGYLFIVFCGKRAMRLMRYVTIRYFVTSIFVYGLLNICLSFCSWYLFVGGQYSVLVMSRK